MLMHKPRPATALVTGAGGTLGGALVHRLRMRGCHVIGMGRMPDEQARLPWLEAGDCTNADDLSRVFDRLGALPEVVYHLAGRRRVHDRDETAYARDNLVATEVLGDACMQRGVPAFVFASTAAVLAAPKTSADGQTERLDSTAAVAPQTAYGRSKRAAERVVDQLASTGRVAAVTLRLFNVLGLTAGAALPREDESRLLPRAIWAATGEGPPLKVHGGHLPTADGTGVRDYIHIEDVLDAFEAAGQRALDDFDAGETDEQALLLHVCRGEGTSVLELLAVVAEILGRDVPHEIAAGRAGDLPEVLGNPDELFAELSVRASRGVHAMVRDAARWMGALPL